VQVYQHELRELMQLGAVELVAEQYTVLRDLSLYDEELGLTLRHSNWSSEPLVF